MPNRRTHVCVAIGAGAVVALTRAQGQQSWYALAETAGGAFGGFLGGMTPDYIEPPRWPGHRSLAHSWAAVGVGIGARGDIVHIIQCWEAYCRKKANLARSTRDMVSETAWRGCVLWLVELFWRVIAGILSGLVAGYASHLVLDAFSPAGLPVVG